MTLQPDTFKSLVKEAAEQVIAGAGELAALDQTSATIITRIVRFVAKRL